MRIKQCIHHDCTEFSTDESQLCDKHLEEHIERCRQLAWKGKDFDDDDLWEFGV